MSEQNIKPMGDPDDFLQEQRGQWPQSVEIASTNPALRQNFRTPFAIMGATSGMVSFASMYKITVSLVDEPLLLFSTGPAILPILGRYSHQEPSCAGT